jgi:hypothetical protein
MNRFSDLDGIVQVFLTVVEVIMNFSIGIYFFSFLSLGACVGKLFYSGISPG